MKYLEIFGKKEIQYWGYIKKIAANLLGRNNIIYYAHIKTLNRNKTIGVLYIISDNMEINKLKDIAIKLEQYKNTLSTSYGEMK